MSVILLLICMGAIMLGIFAGLPLYASFGGGAFVMILLLGMNPGFVVPTMFTNLNSFVLMAVPFFILAGGLMGAAGLSGRIVDFFNVLVGRFRGGLGLVVVASCAFFGAISGSAVSAVATIGLIMIPEMVKRGYRKEYATALVTCSAVLALLIPPSITMILFGMLTNAPVGGCFLAGFIPGIILAILYAIINYLLCRRDPGIQILAPLPPREAVRNIASAARKSAGALGMPFVILGGIYSGLFTPTEAGCVAVVYALAVGVGSGSLSWKAFKESASETAAIEGSIAIIIAFILVIGRIFTYERVPDAIANCMISITSNRVLLLLMLSSFLLLMGMLMDDVSATLLSVPLLYPLFTKLGVPPYQMAAIFTLSMSIGMITPPVAAGLFTAARVSGLPVYAFVKDCIPFLVFACLPVLMIVTFVPQVCTWLPGLILGE